MDGQVSAVRHPRSSRDQFLFEPSERRVRGVIGDVTIVDSRRPVLVWEPGRPVPLYAFPHADVRMELLSPATSEPPAGSSIFGAHRGVGRWYDVLVGGQRLAGAAWSYTPAELSELIAFESRERAAQGVEHWYEEDEEIFVHPRDPFSRVDALASSRHVRVSIAGTLVADSRRPTVLFETGLPVRYYLPAADVALSLFERTELHTRCPYKGLADYWSYVGDGGPVANVVWSYPDPIPQLPQVKDLLAFYNEAVDITVDGVTQERPASPFRNRPGT